MKNIILALALTLSAQHSWALDHLNCSISLSAKGSSKRVSPDLLYIMSDSLIETHSTQNELFVSFNVDKMRRATAGIVIDGLKKNILMTAGINASLDEQGQLLMTIVGDFTDRTFQGSEVSQITYRNDFATLKMSCSL